MSPKIIVLLIFSVFFGISTPAAHRYHTSLTRIDYDADEKLVEITVQVFTNDLEDVLTKKNSGKTPVHLDKTPKVDELVLNYLSDRLIIKNKAGETKIMRWVGLQAENDMTLIYIETAMPEGFEGAMLENSILNDQFDDEVNLVTTRFGKTKTDLVFKTNDRAQNLIKSVEETSTDN